MSDILYPISLVQSVKILPVNRVLADEFEDGTTNTRRMWGDKYFKRRFTVQHAPLSRLEANRLRGFHTERNGTYDSFWFRDNPNRGGNAKVRFGQNTEPAREGQLTNIGVLLAETAPTRALPDEREVYGAAGTEPSLWLDPNRVIYFEHPGWTTFTEATLFDASRTEAWPLTYQSGALVLGDVLAQNQYLDATTSWARTTGNFTAVTGTQPACTVIAFLKRATGGTGRKGLITFGATGTGNAMGIGYNAGAYEPYLGGAESWGTALQSNASGDTWRSIAISWPAASNVASFYTNAALIATESETRNYSAGPLVLNAEPDGTDNDTVHKYGQVLVFAAALTLAQVKAVHNLFCAQYGLATVA